MKPHAKNIQAAVWLIGIGILALTHNWWPGILILVGISMVAGAMTRGTVGPKESWEQPSIPQQPPMPDSPPPATAVVEPAPSPTAPAVKNAVYALGWVPNRCSFCGGPLNINTLKVLDSQTVVCPFCGSRISKAV